MRAMLRPGEAGRRGKVRGVVDNPGNLEHLMYSRDIAWQLR